MPPPHENPGNPELDIRGRAHLELVLQSECFRRAATLRALLLYLWQNKDNDISEYAVAVEALGRSPNFDSRIDAYVRVQISRLRQFLVKFYNSEGASSTARLVIPLGTHQLQFIDAEPSVISEPSPYPSETWRGRLLTAIPATVLALIVFCAGLALGLSAHRSPKMVASAPPELPLFWKTFLDNGKPTRIVLPTPIFFGWGPPENHANILVRDLAVNDFARSSDSASITQLEKQFGKPRPWQNYTVASDTVASLQLARFLDSFGVRAPISTSNQFPGEIVDHENLITFGTASFLAQPWQVELDRLSFKMGPHEEFVIDKTLPAATSHLFPTVEESASRTISPGIIALLPQGPTGGRVLILQGKHTTALITFLTSEEGIREIIKAESLQANSKFFEAVILSEVNAGTPIQSRLVAFRPFAAEIQKPREQAQATPLMPR